MDIFVALYPNREIRVSEHIFTRKSTPSPKSIGEGVFLSESHFETKTNENQNEQRLLSSDESLLASAQESKSCPLPTCPKDETRNEQPGFGASWSHRRYSLYGKRTLKRAGGALDMTYQPSQVVFLTGTLPGSTRQAMDAIANYSSWVVHRLKAWIAKRVASKLDLYVWERQKRGALHLHYCCVVEDDGIRDEIIREFHGQWRRLMLGLNRLSGIDVFARSGGGTWKDNPQLPRSDAQVCESSAVGYLAKYASKESGKTGFGGYCPNRWYGVSRPLLALTRSLTFQMPLRDLSRAVSERIYEAISHTVDSLCSIVTHWRQEGGLRRGIYGYFEENSQKGGIECLLQSSITATSFSDTVFKSENSMRYASIHSLIMSLKFHVGQSSVGFSLALQQSLEKASRKDSLLAETLTRSDWMELRSLLNMFPYLQRAYRYEPLKQYIDYQLSMSSLRKGSSEDDSGGTRQGHRNGICEDERVHPVKMRLPGLHMQT